MIKFKRFYLFLTVFPILVSCDDDNDCCTIIEAGIEFVANIDGQDYFSTINRDGIAVFNFNGETYELVNRPDRDNNQGYSIIPPEASDGNGFIVLVELNIEYIDSDNASLTRIAWTPNDIDTVKAIFDRSNNNLVVIEVQIEGETVWTAAEGGQVVLNK
ncbi:hypothetical protein FGF1_36520 [Flavobacteriaceae bacterium GF1]